jgi:hypothetical protein
LAFLKNYNTARKYQGPHTRKKHAPAQKRSKNGCQDEGRNQQQGRSFSIPHILMIPYPDFRILPESNLWINPPMEPYQTKEPFPAKGTVPEIL